MLQDRFLQIMRFIHRADNLKKTVNNKAWRLRPFMNLKDQCLKNFVPSKNLYYNESMVKYFGKHKCKQFIRGNSIHLDTK